MISPYQLLLFGKKKSKKATNVALPGAVCSKTMVRNVRTTPSACETIAFRKQVEFVNELQNAIALCDIDIKFVIDNKA